MDRESVVTKYAFEAGVNSPPISTARYAWQSLHVGAGFLPADLTWQALNESTGNFDPIYDSDGTILATTVDVETNRVYVIPAIANHARVIRFVSSVSQPEDAAFAVVNKT